MDEREWPHKYQFLDRVAADRHDGAGAVFDSLLWAVGEGPCVGMQTARRAAAPPDMSISTARLGLESALRTLHSGGDLLAQLVAVCLFDPRPAPSSIAMTYKKFKEGVLGVNPALAAQFEALGANDDWVYVADVANTLKHVEALPMVFQLGGGITLLGFKKSGRTYPDRTLDDIGVIVLDVQAQLWELAWALYESLA